MDRRYLINMLLSVACAGRLCSDLQSLALAQGQTIDEHVSLGPEGTEISSVNSQAPLTAVQLDEIIERKIKREHDEIAAFDLYSPIIETYIQEVKFKQASARFQSQTTTFWDRQIFEGD
jgi:hypothetical protein